MNEKVIMAGFGGQGVMAIGKLLTYAGMIEQKEVSWLPSYGPEMRGGTANCGVIVSDSMIGSPVIAQDATSAIIMNLPSLYKFENEIIPNGNIFINSSLVKEQTKRKDIDAYYIDANEIAAEIGNPKAANMVMLGAYLQINNTVKNETVLEAFLKVFGENKEHLLPLNKLALIKGSESVKK